MTNALDPVLVNEFANRTLLKTEQLISKLRPFAMPVEVKGENWFTNDVGGVEFQAVNGLYQPVQFSQLAWGRRAMIHQRIYAAIPIDAANERQILEDLNGVYSARLAAGFNRYIDRLFVTALLATVLTGKAGTTSTTFSSDGGFTVDATAGLTYEKLLEIIQNWIDADYDVAGENKMLTVTGDEHTELMGELELVSGDFTNRPKPSDSGMIERAAGLELIKFGGAVQNPILPVASGVRSLVATLGKPLIFGISKNLSITKQERNDLIETSQILAVADIGAVRVEGGRVQKVDVTE
jgi:hypothetical protein